MAELTIANYLGMLQDGPDDDTAIDGLLEIITGEQRDVSAKTQCA